MFQVDATTTTSRTFVRHGSDDDNINEDVYEEVDLGKQRPRQEAGDGCFSGVPAESNDGVEDTATAGGADDSKEEEDPALEMAAWLVSLLHWAWDRSVVELFGTAITLRWAKLLQLFTNGEKDESTTLSLSSAPSSHNGPPLVPSSGSTRIPTTSHHQATNQPPPILINLAVLTVLAQVSQVFVVVRDFHDLWSTLLALLAFAAIFALLYTVRKALARKPQQQQQQPQHHQPNHARLPLPIPGAAPRRKKKMRRHNQHHHHRPGHQHQTHPQNHNQRGGEGDPGTEEEAAASTAPLSAALISNSSVPMPALLEDRPVSPPQPLLLPSPAIVTAAAPADAPLHKAGGSHHSSSSAGSTAASSSSSSSILSRDRAGTEDTVAATADDDDDWSCESASGRSTPTMAVELVHSSPPHLSPLPRRPNSRSGTASTTPKTRVSHPPLSPTAAAPDNAPLQRKPRQRRQRRKKNKVEAVGKAPPLSVLQPTLQVPPPQPSPSASATPHQHMATVAAVKPCRGAGTSAAAPLNRREAVTTPKRHSRRESCKSNDMAKQHSSPATTSATTSASQRTPRRPTVPNAVGAYPTPPPPRTTPQRHSPSIPVQTRQPPPQRRSTATLDKGHTFKPFPSSSSEIQVPVLLEPPPGLPRDASAGPHGWPMAGTAAPGPPEMAAETAFERTPPRDAALAPGASATPYGTPLQVAPEPPHASFFSSVTWGTRPVPSTSRSPWEGPSSDLYSWTLGEPACGASPAPFAPSTCSVAPIRPPPGWQAPPGLSPSPFGSVLPGLAAPTAGPPPGFASADPFGAVVPPAQHNPFATPVFSPPPPTPPSTEDCDADDSSCAMEAELRGLIGSILDS